MNTFVTNIDNIQYYSTTEKGALTLSTSNSALVDLFFQIGASRQKSVSQKAELFRRAYGENPVLAIKILFWSRDPRQGAGERETFRQLINMFDDQTAAKLIELIPFYGRWDDLLVFVDRKDPAVNATLAATLQYGLCDDRVSGLCAKWMPRNGPVAAKLRKMFGYTPRQWRKMLVEKTNVVETKMCDREWSDIEYSQVPSVAFARYRKAFLRHDPDRYSAFINKVNAGEEKVNASAVFPHDVIKPLMCRFGKIRRFDDVLARSVDAQWAALPNYMQNMRVLPVIDVSGSMYTNISGNTQAVDIAVGLGLYCAQKNQGDYHNVYSTFSRHPKLKKAKGEHISEMIASIDPSDWGMTTDIHACLNLILDHSIKHNVDQDEMPEMLLIISDMEFDDATNLDTPFEVLCKQYQQAGYQLPKVVFWNVVARSNSNIPVTYRQDGVALISGFNTAILQSVLGGEINPQSVMLKTINNPHYDAVESALLT